MLKGNILHLQQLQQGKESWNAWKDTGMVRPDLKGFNLDGMDLSGYHLDQTDFTDASMVNCNLNNTTLCWCVFIRTKLNSSTIINTDWETYTGDKRQMGINLRWSAFADADLTKVDMRGATLEATSFYNCKFNGTDLTGSDVYGVSAWGNQYDEYTKQDDLVVSNFDEDIITIDNLELAQFIYLLLNSTGVRDAINALTTKVVLILGSFASPDMQILQNIKTELRLQNYIPMLYNFEKPVRRNHIETVSTIAHLANFIVAELTNPRSIPNELATLIPTLRSVPVIPLIRDGQKPYGMFEDFQDLRHVSALIEYNTTDPVKFLVNDVVCRAKEIFKDLSISARS